MTVRLRNAMRFLIEADRQEHDAVGLALCFAAIEAIACNPKEKVVLQIKQRGSVLLEGSADCRDGAAGVLGALYDIRCRCMHGELRTGSRRERLEAMLVAAASLFAAMGWFGSVVDRGGKPLTDDFMRALDDARERAGNPEGVDQWPASALWRRNSRPAQ
jgi:hypothetical protein